MFENLSERLERSFKILKGEGKITEITKVNEWEWPHWKLYYIDMKLDNGETISLGKKIIPVLFDKIESLSDSSIMIELNKNFNARDIEIIVKSQCVPYSTNFPDASITKLVHFIEEANETRSVLDKTLRVIKGISIVLVALILFFAMFFKFS